MASKTRWKPRKVFCTQTSNHADHPGVPCVVKFRQGPIGTAALISELVCTYLLDKAGFETLDVVIVNVGNAFSISCQAKSEIPYPVLPGHHFGTMLRDDVEAGPPLRYDDLANPVELVDLWVFDTWLGNIDREQDGNILLALAGSGTFDIIAADQSDCFCGSGVFSSPQFADKFRKAKRAPSVSFLPSIIAWNGGSGAIYSAINKVKGACAFVPEALGIVPVEWWQESGCQPGWLHQNLLERATRLEHILEPRIWGQEHGNLSLSF